MGQQNRGTNPEEEYFARREGERERDRERDRADEAARKALDERAVIARQEEHGGDDDTSAETSESREAGTTSRIVGAMSTAMKALFGIRGNRRRHHA